MTDESNGHTSIYSLFAYRTIVVLFLIYFNSLRVTRTSLSQGIYYLTLIILLPLLAILFTLTTANKSLDILPHLRVLCSY